MSRRWSDPSKPMIALAHRPLPVILQRTERSFASLDKVLQDPELLFHEALANDIEIEVESMITRAVTPPLMWGGDPSKMPRYYLKCMTRATILGRAFAALSPASSPDVSLDITRPSRFGKNVASLPHELRLQIYEQFLMIYEQRRRLWSLFAEIFRLGLLSGPDPEPGARFCSAILILTAGKAAWLIKDQLTASGTEWSWIDRSVGSPDRRWNMQFVLNSFVRQARELPRDNYRWNELIEERDLAYGNGQILEPREYVPLEVVDVFDKTLAKVEADEPDWNGAKIIETYERDWIKLWQRTSDINQACRGASTAFNVF